MAFVALAIAGALPLHVGDDLAVPPGTQGKVEKARSGNLHLVKKGALQIQVVAEGLGQWARGAMCMALAPAIAKEEA